LVDCEVVLSKSLVFFPQLIPFLSIVLVSFFVVLCFRPGISFGETFPAYSEILDVLLQLANDVVFYLQLAHEVDYFRLDYLTALELVTH
jgi:hypothetical protein